MFVHLLLRQSAVTPENNQDNFLANGTTDRVHQLTVEGPSDVAITAKALVEVTNFRSGGWFVESEEKTLVKPIGNTVITDKWAPVSGPFAFIRARITQISDPVGKVTVTMGGV